MISGVGAEDSWQTSMGLGSEAAALQIKILSTTKRTKGVFSVLKKTHNTNKMKIYNGF